MRILALLLTGLLLLGIAETRANTVSEQQLINGYLQQQRVELWLSATRRAAESAASDRTAWQNPQLEFEYEPTPLDNGGKETETSVWLSQSFANLVGASHRSAAAQSAVDVSSLEALLYLRNEIQALLTDYYRLILLRELHVNQRSVRDALAEMVDHSKQQFELNEQSELAYFRLQQELALANFELTDIARQALELTEQLSNETGIQVTELSGELLPSDLSFATETQPLELQILSNRLDQLRAEEQLAKTKIFPEVTVGLGLRRINSPADTQSELAARLAFELPLFDRGQYASEQLASELAVVQVEQARLEQKLRQRKQTLANVIRSDMQSLEQLPKARRAAMLDAANQAYRLGEYSVAELIDVVRSINQVQTQTLKTAFRVREHWLELQSYALKNQEILP